MGDKYLNSRNYFLIYSELITTARFRGIVSYQELADLVGLPLRGNHMGRELSNYLGTISENEVKHQRPMLSAIAVNVTGLPGSGFFQLAKDSDLLHEDTKEGQMLFWEAEKERVYDTWRRTLHK